MRELIMNSDIRLSVTFFQHRKTKKIAKKIGNNAVISLLKLWSRVAIEKPDGVLSGWDNEDIALEADFEGDADEFVNCLLAVGFLDECDGEHVLHNWSTRQGWVVRSSERSDKARLSRMAKTHPDIYEELVNDGVTAVSRTEYDSLTKAKRIVNESLTKTNATLTPAPAPDPVPVPSPDPTPDPVPAHSDTQLDSVLVIFDHWKKVHNHPRSQLDDKRKKSIKARMKDGYSFQDCINAVNGCKKSPFHQGENDNNRIYDAVDLIFRNAEKMDYFIKQNAMPDLTGCSAAGRATLMAGANVKKELEEEARQDESI